MKIVINENQLSFILMEASKQEMESVAIKIGSSFSGKDKEKMKDEVVEAYDVINDIAQTYNINQAHNYLPLVMWGIFSDVKNANQVKDILFNFFYLLNYNKIKSYDIQKEKEGKLYKDIKLIINYPDGSSENFSTVSELQRRVDNLMAELKQSSVQATNNKDDVIDAIKSDNEINVILEKDSFFLIFIPPNDFTTLKKLCNLMDTSFCIINPRNYFDYRGEGATFYILINKNLLGSKDKERMIIIEVSEYEEIKVTSALNDEGDLGGEEYLVNNYPNEILGYFESEPVTRDEKLIMNLIEDPEDIPNEWQSLEEKEKEVLIKTESLSFPSETFNKMTDKEIYRYMKERFEDIINGHIVYDEDIELTNNGRLKEIFKQLVDNNWNKVIEYFNNLPPKLVVSFPFFKNDEFIDYLIKAINEVNSDTSKLILARNILNYDMDYLDNIMNIVNLYDINLDYVYQQLNTILPKLPQNFYDNLSTDEVFRLLNYYIDNNNAEGTIAFVYHLDNDLNDDTILKILNGEYDILGDFIKLIDSKFNDNNSVMDYFNELIRKLNFDSVVAVFNRYVSILNKVERDEFFNKIVQNIDDEKRQHLKDIGIINEEIYKFHKLIST